jgi:hypothetical protein
MQQLDERNWWDRKTGVECPFCKGFFLNIEKRVLTEAYFECYLICSSCGFELVGRKDFVKVEVSRENSEKEKYNKLFNKFRRK